MCIGNINQLLLLQTDVRKVSLVERTNNILSLVTNWWAGIKSVQRSIFFVAVHLGRSLQMKMT